MIFPGSEKKGVYRVSERSVKAMTKKSGTFWKKVPCSLTGLALGLQSAVTAFLLFLSVFCTVFFQRSAPEVGNVTEKAEFCSGIPSAAFCLGTVALLVILALLAVGISRLPKRWVLFALPHLCVYCADYLARCFRIHCLFISRFAEPDRCS